MIMRSLCLGLLFLNFQAEAAVVQKFTTKDNTDLYRIEMEDRFDQVEIQTKNLYLTIDDIVDYRCPPTLIKCWNGGVTIEGRLNSDKYKLKVNESFFNNVNIKFDHMVGGYEGEPYIFDLEVING